MHVTVHPQPAPPPPAPQYNIIGMSEAEAQFLADILARISGDMDHSRRQHAESIRLALSASGVHWHHADDMSGTIGFAVEHPPQASQPISGLTLINL